MNNFSDLLATDHRISVILVLASIADNGVPGCDVMINGRLFHQGPLRTTVEIITDIELLDPIDIQISLWGKVYSDTAETAILLRQVSIDGFPIIPDWTHLASYENDHHDGRPTGYLGYNGTWRLSIPEPFYRWRHKVTGQGWLLHPTR